MASWLFMELQEATRRERHKHGEESRETGRVVRQVWRPFLKNLRDTLFLGQWVGEISLASTLPSVEGGPHSSAWDTVGDRAIQALTTHTLHAKLINYVWESHELLRQGFSDGATSRLRAAYECLTIGTLLEHEDAILAVRYHDSAALSHYRLVRARTDCCDVPPWIREEARAELEEADQGRERVLTHWAWPASSSSYEWARPVVVQRKKRELTFRDVEEAAKLDHQRSLYSLLSSYVHVEPVHVINHIRLDNPSRPLPFTPILDYDMLVRDIPFPLLTAHRLVADSCLSLASLALKLSGDTRVVDAAQGVAMLAQIRIQSLADQELSLLTDNVEANGA